MNKLEELLVSQRARFDALAAVWLQAGANAFGISRDGRTLATWSNEPYDCTARLQAPVSSDGKTVAELWVVGQEDTATHARLNMDASLVSQWVKLESEIETMTGDLIDVQDRLLALYDLNRALRRFLNLDTLLPAVTREAARLIQCGKAFVYVQTPDGQTHTAQTGELPLDTTRLQHLGNDMFRHNKPLVFAADEADGLIALSLHNLMCVPLKQPDGLLVMLGWADKAQGMFTSPDIKLGQAIAEQASAEIENVLLYTELLAQARLRTELELARNIQKRLVPQRVPHVAGLDVSARMLPALQVGGDFYDAIEAPLRPFCIALGDVSGKGISAALVMAIVRTSLRTKARFMPNATPASILTRLTEELYDDLTELSMFATTFVVQFDHAHNELVFANAGHAPVIFVPKNREPQLLEADSAPLGVLPISLAENVRIPFGVNDVLVVATDGFSEARNAAGELFGIPRLMEAIRERADNTAREISDALFGLIAEYSQGKMEDDQTLVVIKGVAE